MDSMQVTLQLQIKLMTVTMIFLQRSIGSYASYVDVHGTVQSLPLTTNDNGSVSVNIPSIGGAFCGLGPFCKTDPLLA